MFHMTDAPSEGPPTLQAYADRAKRPTSEAAGVAMLLAIGEQSSLGEVSEVQLARLVADGLRPASAVALAAVLGRKRVIGPIVPEATFRRVRKARKSLSRQLSERLYGLARVVDAASRTYRGNRDDIVAFLNRPNQLLGGETPFDIARSSSAGTDAVVNLLLRAQAGFPV